MDSIEIRVKRIIGGFICKDSTLIKNEDELHSDLDIDSLERVEVMFSLEDEFAGVVISDENAAQVYTVQDAIDLMIRLVNPTVGVAA